jgi:SAM-dependent methyltransferase
MGEEGFLHGIDSSPAMIMAANKAAAANKLQGFTRFDVLNAADVPNVPHYKHDFYNKAFSNAAMHWILAPLTEEKRRTFFEGVKGALKPGGVFAFEMGGLGNCSELLAGILMGVGSRVGLEAAKRANPWFFPDEDWITDMMEKKVGGWKIEKIERVWRPTTADAGGVDGWIRLMAKQFFEIVPEEEREACIRDVVETLEVVCAKPGGGYMFSYVRLRVLARKVE